MVETQNMDQMFNLTDVAKINKALESYDKYTEDKDFQKVQLNNVFIKAEKKFHNTIEDKIEKEIGDDTKSLGNKKDELQKVITASLKEYFKVVQPSALETEFGGSAWDLSSMSTEDQYLYLTTLYDSQTGSDPSKDPESLTGLAERLAMDDDRKVGDLKSLLYMRGAKNAQKGLAVMNSKKTREIFKDIDSESLAKYIQLFAEDNGYELKDVAKKNILKDDIADLLGIRNGIIKGDWSYHGEKVSPSEIGYKKKIENKADNYLKAA